MSMCKLDCGCPFERKQHAFPMWAMFSLQCPNNSAGANARCKPKHVHMVQVWPILVRCLYVLHACTDVCARTHTKPLRTCRQLPASLKNCIPFTKQLCHFKPDKHTNVSVTKVNNIIHKLIFKQKSNSGTTNTNFMASLLLLFFVLLLLEK